MWGLFVADFKTHLAGAAAVSAVLSGSLASAELVDGGDALGIFSIGVVGGLLPDIDLGHSVPVAIARKAVTAFGVLVIAIQLLEVYSIIEIAIVSFGMYYLVQAGFKLFDKFTKHRGLFHSVPAALVAGLILGVLMNNFSSNSDSVVWFYTLFMFLGFILHLLLDELYSVNLLGASFKRSFGTALKLGDKKNPVGTSALYLGAVLLYLFNPPIDSFTTVITDSSTYSTIFDNLLPDDQWFRPLEN